MLDRRAQPFVPVYTELFRAVPDAAGRSGYALSGSVAVFFSTIVYLQGSPADGRRQTRSEIDGKERFVARTPSAGDLTRMYGWTYDEIQGWAETLAAPRSCPHCARAHALLRIERRPGHRNRYRLLRCQDLGDDECTSPSLTVREKRAPTGAADPATRPRRTEQQVSLPFDPPETVGVRPASIGDEGGGGNAGEGGTLGQTPTVFSGAAFSSGVETLGQCPKVGPGTNPSQDRAVFATPRTDEEARIMVLRGFAKLEGANVELPALTVLARAIADPAELLNALIFAIAAASLDHVPLDAITAQKAAERYQERLAKPSDNVRGPDWATARIHDLARTCEPHTTPVHARAMRDEFYAHCLEHAGGDAREAGDELQRILTDPRICGTVGVDPPLKPLALLRDAFRKGWIWTRAYDDDGTGALARAFERLSPGDRAEVEHIIGDALTGQPLNYARLRTHHISSKPMIAYLQRRFAAT